ncbi:MAG TPA: acireductone synthase [Pyrinomonadaceae bacterium]|nr:acireductone synthase [Pyrinomonadaceae bacterium]
MTSSLLTEGIRGVLLDIEGTTTPIAFVHEVLFSYARLEVRSFLTERFGAPELAADLQQLREEHATDVKQNRQPPALVDVDVNVDGPRDAEIDSLAGYVNWLIDRDRKSTGLKSLQGKIWKQGYGDGTLKAQLFADVRPALERWRRAGLKISIFSSGSSLAQKLLFAHTEAGDLTGFIDNYFDTTVGSKTDVASYSRIASALHLQAQEVLFISDVVPELDAAGAAGMQTLLCVRPGNQPQPFAEQYQIIRDFNEIPFAQRFA